LRDRRHPDEARLISSRAGREDSDDGEEGDEHDASVPPDPHQVEAGHEARIPASLRPEANARRDAAQARRDAPLDLHPRSDVDLAEAGRHRMPDAMDYVP